MRIPLLEVSALGLMVALLGTGIYSACRVPVDDANSALDASGPTAKGSVTRVTWSSDGTLLFARSWTIHSPMSSLTLHDITGPTGSRCVWNDSLGISSNDAVIAPDAKRVLLSTQQCQLWWLDLKTSDITDVGESHPGMYYGIAVSHDGNVLAAATECGDILITAMMRDGSKILKAHRRSTVAKMQFSSDDHRLLIVRLDGSHEIWDLARTTLLLERQPHFGISLPAGFIKNDTCVLSLCSKNQVEIWNATTGEVEWCGNHNQDNNGAGATLDVSPDGRNAAWSCHDRRIVVWDVERQCGRFEIVNPAMVLHVCFSPDGSRLAVAANEVWIRIYSAETGAQLMQIDACSRSNTDGFPKHRNVTFACPSIPTTLQGVCAQGSEITHNFAAGASCHGSPDDSIDVLTDEFDGAITHQQIDAAHMLTAGCFPSDRGVAQ